MKAVELAAVGVDAESGTPVVLLREQDAPHRLLPIVVGPSDAAAIAFPATGRVPDRPMTADLLTAVLTELDATVDAVEVTELRGGTYLARLNLHDAAGHHSLDARPSDAIAVALRCHAPLLVADEVLDEAGTLPPPEIDETAIDAEIEEFREFLEGLEPEQFALDNSDGEPEDGGRDEPRPGEEE